MENRNNNRNDYNNYASRDEFSRNAINSRDDRDPSWNYSEYNHGNQQQSNGQQYRNFQPENSRGINQFGIRNNNSYNSGNNDNNYYRSNNYGRMNEDLNRYDSSFDRRNENNLQHHLGYGVDFNAYGRGRRNNNEYRPETEGYNGRNASDYTNNYGDNYYSPDNDDDSSRRRSTYGSEHQGHFNNYYGRSHSDYFDHQQQYDGRGASTNYGSYPSYNQSRANDRDEEEYRQNIRDRRY